MRRAFPSLPVSEADTAPESHANRFWSSAIPARSDAERPTVRPTGEPEAMEAATDSGVHAVVPVTSGADVESIESALRKLLAG